MRLVTAVAGFGRVLAVGPPGVASAASNTAATLFRVDEATQLVTEFPSDL